MFSKIFEWARCLFGFRKESQTAATVNEEQAEMPVFRQAPLLDPNDWERMERAMEQGQPLNCHVLSCKKGGYTVSVLGIYAFLPKSLAHYRMAHTPERVLGKQFLVYVRSVGKAQVLVSHIEFVKEAYSRLAIGDICNAVVDKILDGGLLVYMPDNELYATVSQRELSWSLEVSISDYCVGQQVKVSIIKKDDLEKIRASIRQAGGPNPYEKCIDDYHVGDVLIGMVINVVDFGAFVELSEGVVGLLHRTEVRWGEPAPNMKHVFKIGETMKVMVCRIDNEQRRIFLSLKRLNLDKIADSYKPGSIHSALITHVAEKHVTIELPYGLTTKIRMLRFAKAGMDPTEGEKVRVQIISYDKESNEVKVGLRIQQS